MEKFPQPTTSCSTVTRNSKGESVTVTSRRGTRDGTVSSSHSIGTSRATLDEIGHSGKAMSCT